ncbi:MAG: hypothetical protein GY810_26065 [Aureispira sp.]|nr:hypothetical protein [Aureispira sp.]
MRFMFFVLVTIALSACKVQTIQFPNPVENVSMGMEFKTLFKARPGMTIVNSVGETPYREFQQMINKNGIKEIHFYIPKKGNMQLYQVKLWFTDAEKAKTMAKTFFGQPKKNKNEWIAQTSEGDELEVVLKNATLNICSKDPVTTVSLPTE